MNRAWIQKSALLLGALLIQTSPGVSAWGVDMPLVFTALVGVRCGLLESLVWGILAGLFQDTLSACGPGPHAVANGAVAFLAFISQNTVFREKVLTQAGLVGTCMALHQAMLWFLFRFFEEGVTSGDEWAFVTRSVLVTTVAGAMVSWVIIRYRRLSHDPATA